MVSMMCNAMNCFVPLEEARSKRGVQANRARAHRVGGWRWVKCEGGADGCQNQACWDAKKAKHSAQMNGMRFLEALVAFPLIPDFWLNSALDSAWRCMGNGRRSQQWDIGGSCSQDNGSDGGIVRLERRRGTLR